MNTGKSAEALGEGQDAAGGTSGTSTGSTFFASLSRTLLFIWGMMLKRPSRLFRPSRGPSFPHVSYGLFLANLCSPLCASQSHPSPFFEHSPGVTILVWTPRVFIS